MDTALNLLTITAETITNASGSLVIQADGDFTYLPAAGFSGNAVFTYTLNDNDPLGNATDTGNITINVPASPRVWYVDPNAATNGDGTSDNPFNTLTQLNGLTGDGTTNDDVDGANDIIFVYGGTLSAGITLEDGQQLIGQSVGLTVSGTALEAATGSNPLINGAVVLGSGNTINGIDIGNTSGFALSGTSIGTATVSNSSINNTSGGALSITTGGTLNATFTNFSSSAGTNAVNLVGVNGTVNLGTGALSNTTGTTFNVSGGAANITYNGTITDDDSRLVAIASHTGGTIDFNGAISDGNDGDGQGISLTNNTGATVSFDGGLTLSTGGNAAFAATGGGTVTVTGTNHLTTTTGTALNISNTTIGSGNVTFHDISAGTGAGGPANGIILNTTGATGHLTVTGDGNTSLGGNNSGGIIQHTTSHGISLTDTLSPSFTNMSIHDIARNGIDGTGVVNFTFDNGQITNTGTAVAGQFEESAIAFVDRTTPNPTDNTVSGNVIITDSLISAAHRNAIMIETWNGTISNLNISNNTMTGGTNLAALHDSTLATTADIQDAIHVFTQGSATTTANLTTGTINNNTISGFEFFSGGIFIGGNGIRVAGGSGNGSNSTTATLGAAGNPIEISGNDIDDMGSNAIAVSFNGVNGLSNFNIHHNGTIADPMSNVEGLGISVFFGGNGTFSALVNNNAVDNNGPTVNAGSSGIAVQLDDGPAGLANTTGVATIHVNNNTVTNPDGFGIRGIVRASNGTLNLYIQNNDVGTPSAANRNAIRVDSGSTAGDTTLNLNMSGNSGPLASLTDNLVGSGLNAGIGLRRQGSVAGVNEFNIQGITANPTNAQVQAYIGSPVPPGFNYTADGTGGSANGVDIISGSGFGTTNAVPLLAAAGGVDAVFGEQGEFNLSQSDLDLVVGAALEYWASAGLSATQLAMLQSLDFSVTDLGGDALGYQSSGHVLIDNDGAGFGWFVDATPLDDAEFAYAAGIGAVTDRWLWADPSQAPAGDMDLLTAVMHEMGHALGLDDTYAAADRAELMFGALVTGERRLPGIVDVARAGFDYSAAELVFGASDAVMDGARLPDLNTDFTIPNYARCGTVDLAGADTMVMQQMA